LILRLPLYRLYEENFYRFAVLFFSTMCISIGISVL
jgi:hypothetical protein